MIYFFGAFTGVVVVELLLRLPFTQAITTSVLNANKAFSVIKAPRISEHWKERVVLKYALTIFVATAKLGLYLLGIFLSVFLISLLSSLFKQDLFDFLLHLEGLIFTTVVSFIYVFFRKKAPPSKYGRASKFIHYLALGIPSVTEASFDIEQMTQKPDALSIAEERHVFIAGLARAGTTILMRRFYASQKFSSLTYQDMPFVLMPNLWRQLSAFLKKQAIKEERAHGDGLLVDFNSPEAFEEIFWRIFTENNYIQRDKLIPVSIDDTVIVKFQSYIATILSSGKKERYLSKNNNNILRLEAIKKAFPNVVIIVPFRNPLQQADSLLRLHQKFVIEQGNDKFLRNYMGWLVHYEFGLEHRPFSFPRQEQKYQDSADINYWLELWLNTYGWLYDFAPEGTIFQSYEKLCRDLENTWLQLSKLANIPPETYSSDIISQKINPIEGSASKELLEKADTLYRSLELRNSKL